MAQDEPIVRLVLDRERPEHFRGGHRLSLNGSVTQTHDRLQTEFRQPFVAHCRQRSAHGHGHATRNGQSDPCARNSTPQSVLAPDKTTENLRQFLGRHRVPGIKNRNHYPNLAIRFRCRTGDHPRTRRHTVFERVGDKVRHHLPEFATIALQPKGLRQFQRATRQRRVHPARCALNRRAQFEGFLVQLNLAPVDAGKIEHVVQHGSQLTRASFERADQHALTRGHRASRSLVENVAESDNAIERIANLVTQRRKKVFARPLRLF